MGLFYSKIKVFGNKNRYNIGSYNKVCMIIKKSILFYRESKAYEYLDRLFDRRVLCDVFGGTISDFLDKSLRELDRVRV